MTVALVIFVGILAYAAFWAWAESGSDRPIALHFYSAFWATGGALGYLVAFYFFSTSPLLAKRRGWVRAGAVALVAAVASFWAMNYFDILETPDAPPSWLQKADRRISEATGGVLEYPLRSGFLDYDKLWRIRLTPEQAGKMAQALGLEPAGALPDQFWSMPPRWWPDGAPAGSATFASPHFNLHANPDGSHFLMIYDPRSEAVYVWEKWGF